MRESVSGGVKGDITSDRGAGGQWGPCCGILTTPAPAQLGEQAPMNTHTPAPSPATFPAPSTAPSPAPSPAHSPTPYTAPSTAPSTAPYTAPSPASRDLLLLH